MFNTNFAHDWIQTQTSDIGSDRSINWATPLPQKFLFLFQISFEWVGACTYYRLGNYG